MSTRFPDGEPTRPAPGAAAFDFGQPGACCSEGGLEVTEIAEDRAEVVVDPGYHGWIVLEPQRQALVENVAEPRLAGVRVCGPERDERGGARRVRAGGEGNRDCLFRELDPLVLGAGEHAKTSRCTDDLGVVRRRVTALEELERPTDPLAGALATLPAHKCEVGCGHCGADPIAIRLERLERLLQLSLSRPLDEVEREPELAEMHGVRLRPAGARPPRVAHEQRRGTRRGQWPALRLL